MLGNPNRSEASLRSIRFRSNINDVECRWIPLCAANGAGRSLPGFPGTAERRFCLSRPAFVTGFWGTDNIEFQGVTGSRIALHTVDGRVAQAYP